MDNTDYFFFVPFIEICFNLQISVQEMNKLYSVENK